LPFTAEDKNRVHKRDTKKDPSGGTKRKQPSSHHGEWTARTKKKTEWGGFQTPPQDNHKKRKVSREKSISGERKKAGGKESGRAGRGR